jgi:hypothetical protein
MKYTMNSLIMIFYYQNFWTSITIYRGFELRERKLINIKYAAIEIGEGGAINYSALAIYEVGFERPRR